MPAFVEQRRIDRGRDHIRSVSRLTARYPRHKSMAETEAPLELSCRSSSQSNGSRWVLEWIRSPSLLISRRAA
jgi:hypothetical protein